MSVEVSSKPGITTNVSEYKDLLDVKLKPKRENINLYKCQFKVKTKFHFPTVFQS